jgi:tRNA G18 (ribose-2'-O)-methylase SpoU
MRLDQVIEIVKGHALNEFNHARQVEYGFETALLSDVLAYAIPHTTLIITEITNHQVIRTAEMVDAAGVLFVKNKQPDASAIQLACELGIPLIVTRLGMFETCGRLFAAGIKPARHVE